MMGPICVYTHIYIGHIVMIIIIASSSSPFVITAVSAILIISTVIAIIKGIVVIAIVITIRADYHGMFVVQNAAIGVVAMSDGIAGVSTSNFRLNMVLKCDFRASGVPSCLNRV